MWKYFIIQKLNFPKQSIKKRYINFHINFTVPESTFCRIRAMAEAEMTMCVFWILHRLRIFGKRKREVVGIGNERNIYNVKSKKRT